MLWARAEGWFARIRPVLTGEGRRQEAGSQLRIAPNAECGFAPIAINPQIPQISQIRSKNLPGNSLYYSLAFVGSLRRFSCNCFSLLCVPGVRSLTVAPRMLRSGVNFEL